MNHASMLRLTLRDDGVALIDIDVAGEPQNIIKKAFVEQANVLLDRLEQTPHLKGAVFRSAKPGSFIAGADIHMLADCADAAEVTALACEGQAFCNRVAEFKQPLVAAVDGVCLGGGLEFALACHGRVCSDADRTRFGLPEVQLGLLPGSGGTQRLPRLIGVTRALDLMLTGRHLRPRQARRLGLVDEVVPATILLQAALNRIDELAGWKLTTAPKPGLQRWLLRLPPARKLLFARARKQTLGKTRGNYPAPERIIDCVEHGITHGLRAGLAFEAERFGELSQTPQARQLMNLYFAVNALKKDRPGGDVAGAAQIDKIAVLGAGLMGAGISYVSSAVAGAVVRLKDRDAESLNRGLKTVDRLIRERLERRRISPYEAGQQRRRVQPTLDYSGFSNVDLVIEAVFEDLDLKHQMLADTERHAAGQTIFASNTSSLPIQLIAAKAERPERVIGMHYFSPVEKMPLLEVIRTERTAPQVLAAAVEFGRRQGKTVIVVGDKAGFYVNRILTPYVNEAGHLLTEGVAVDVIDRAMRRFGFPVGPFELLDEVGVDVGVKVGAVLSEAFGERLQPPAAAERLVAEGRLGKKSGRGFYRYRRGKSKQVDPALYALLGVSQSGRGQDDDGQIAERCVLPLLNEAARCLAEEVVRSPRDGDVGAVFGIGFPPFLGGPFRYLDSLGAETVVERLCHYQQQHGERFAPAESLLQLAADRGRFYPLSQR